MGIQGYWGYLRRNFPKVFRRARVNPTSYDNVYIDVPNLAWETWGDDGYPKLEQDILRLLWRCRPTQMVVFAMEGHDPKPGHYNLFVKHMNN